MWETAATFDPETGELVHHGGHVTYEQSSYTYLYHPDNGTIRPCEATTDTAASLLDKMAPMLNHAKFRSLRTDCQAMAPCHQVNSRMEFTLLSKLPTKLDRGCTDSAKDDFGVCPYRRQSLYFLSNMRRWPMTQAAMSVYSTRRN